MKGKSLLIKVMGIVCTLALLVGAIYVPVSLYASAAVLPVEDDETLLFTFNSDEGSVTGQGDPNNLTRGDDGVGCAGWGIGISTREDRPQRFDKLGVYHTNEVSYADNGGYRLNNKDGVYNLEPLTTYVVSFKLQVNSAPLNTSKLTASMKTYVKLGYGFTNAGKGNPVSSMKTVISDVFEAVSVPKEDKANATFALIDALGSHTYTVGDAWYDLTYVFTTPEDMGEGVPSLGFYSSSFYGSDYFIDDVAVTKVGDNNGVIITIDEYSGKMDVLKGEKGATAELEVLTSENEDHEFLGWFKDEGRTESAEGITFGDAVQTIYSSWLSPVSVTFIDTLNGGEPYVVSGVAGKKIVYPKDPVDEQNEPDQKWFMGWYTTEQYTEEFTLDEFGYKDLTVYSKWQGEYETLVEDFEDYSSDKRSEKVESDGKKYYSNRYYFGYAMEKIEEEGNHLIKFNWKSDTVKLADVAGSYDAAKRYSSLDHIIKMEDAVLLDGVTYTATFDYKVESIAETQNITVWPYNVHPYDVWTGGENFKSTQNAFITVNSEQADGEWHKGEFTFTMRYSNEKTTGLFIMLGLAENSDATLCFDNFTFVPVQPYKAQVTYYANNGEDPVTFEGNRGEAIPEYIPENNGLTFLGWYSDKELTVPCDITTFPRASVLLYAKWAGVAFEFDNYTPSTNTGVFATQCMSVANGEGVGYKDNSALCWHYKGDTVWKVENGKTEYIADRGNGGRDFKAYLGAVEDKTTYEITYYVKTEMTDSSYQVLFATGHPAGVWQAGYVSYDNSTCYVDKATAGDGWIKKTAILTTAFGTEKASNLYILFKCDNPKKEHEVIAYVDRIIVTKVEDNLVVFNPNAEIDTVFQRGNVGDKISFPNYKNGKSQLLGWFSDAACEIPFTATEMAEGVTNVYAKWSVVPIGFDKYKYASSNRNEFGVSMSVIEKDGVGVDDNFALRWHVDGEMIRNVNNDGTVVYMKDRAANAQDNFARIGVLKDKTAYKITYYYKAAEDSNCDAKISFATGHSANVWEKNYKHYKYTEQSVPLKQTEWTKVETRLVTDFGDEKGNMLLLNVTADASKIPDGINATVYVDNVMVEEISKPYVVFDGQNNAPINIVSGAPGEAITFPNNPIKNNFDFDGWYLDKEFTVPFDKTVFAENEAYVVYAKYVRSSVAYYDFENYGKKATPGWNLFGNGITIEKQPVAYSGETVVKLDRREVAAARLSHLIVAGEGINFELDPSRKYVATFKYYVEQRGTEPLRLYFRSGHEKSAFAGTATLSDVLLLNVVAEEGVWKTGTLVLDASKIPEDGKCLYLIGEKGKDFVIYIDDLTLETLPENYAAYLVDNADSKNVPTYVAGPIGSSFANKLPKQPKKDNHIFIGYTKLDANKNSEELTADKMIFSEEYMKITAEFVRLVTTQDFDGDYSLLFVTDQDYSTIDFDWEHYDARKEGNSKDNVTSGNFSLHRKGDSYYFENAQLLTQAQMLNAGERYTITLKVKMGKHFQTDGALKVVSNRSPFYPWATTGDYYPIVAMADLTDGEWHEVSYTFNAVERYLSLQSPGYCELFIDDVVIKRVDKEATPLSTPVSFTEYVPAKRDANGNLVKKDTSIDVTTIVDSSLTDATVSLNVTLIALIAGAALIVIAGAVVAIVIISKKRKKKV